MIYIKNESGEWIEGEPTENGQEYKETFPAGGIIATFYSAPPEPKPIYTTANEAVTVNGNPTQGYNSVYFGKMGDSINITMDLVDSNDIKQTQIDQSALGYPEKLELPLVKLGGSSVVLDEIYVESTINAGVITASGSFPTSGNWCLLCDRVNESLAEIGADWEIQKPDISFRIGS